MQPILIAGVHRSGTSWVARALHLAGAHLGEELLGAEPSNPYGHFEDERVIALHDDALATQGLTWKSTTALTRPGNDVLEAAIGELVAERRGLVQPWAIKDPRLCLFLPEWLLAAPDARVVVVIRRPDEVVQSLHRRHAKRWVDTNHLDPSDTAFWQKPDLGLRLWIHYNEQLLSSLQQVDDENIHVVRWHDGEGLANLTADVEAKWELGLSSAAIDRDDSLGQRASAPIEVRDTALIERASAVWRSLEGLG